MEKSAFVSEPHSRGRPCGDICINALYLPVAYNVFNMRHKAHMYARTCAVVINKAGGVLNGF